jgi:hypothetical protein
VPQPLTRCSAPPPLARGKEALVVAGPEPRAAASPARASSAPTPALLAPRLLQHRRPRSSAPAAYATLCSSAPAACAPLLRRPSARTRRQRRAHSRARLRRALPAPPEPRGGERGAAGVEIDKGGGKRERRQGEEEQRERKNRGEGEKGFPKDLCINLENCRDLSVKHNFLLI